MKTFMYINPQSMRNLAIYDYSLLSHMQSDVHYVGSMHYDYKPLPSHIHFHPLFRYNELRHNWSKAFSYLLSYLRIFCLILRLRPRTIHVQWLRLPAFDIFFFGLIKRLTGCKVVFTAHNILPHDTGTRYLKSYRRWYQLTDHIIVHAKATQSEFHDTFPDIPLQKVVVISHGVLQMEHDPAALRQNSDDYERRYGLSGRMVFSALGYQYPYKGVDLLAEVWASTPALRDNPELKLLFVGKNKGADLSAAKGIDNVIIEDRLIPDDEFYFLLSHTDVYLLPYREISQSGVLLTAIAEGVPVLATEVGGLTEPFEIAPIGWTLPPDSASQLRSLLLHLSSHPEEVQQKKEDKEMWNRVQKYYGWERIARLTMELYEAPF
ncbi:MAG: glycosyltransferase family 4 protein [Bacteroidaceae bacterium]|nr:glycosyltransferase family 4 protein [Bacteroidaceae bacterium]